MIIIYCCKSQNNLFSVFVVRNLCWPHTLLTFDAGQAYESITVSSIRADLDYLLRLCGAYQASLSVGLPVYPHSRLPVLWLGLGRAYGRLYLGDYS